MSPEDRDIIEQARKVSDDNPYEAKKRTVGSRLADIGIPVLFAVGLSLIAIGFTGYMRIGPVDETADYGRETRRQLDRLQSSGGATVPSTTENRTPDPDRTPKPKPAPSPRPPTTSPTPAPSPSAPTSGSPATTTTTSNSPGLTEAVGSTVEALERTVACALRRLEDLSQPGCTNLVP